MASNPAYTSKASGFDRFGMRFKILKKGVLSISSIILIQLNCSITCAWHHSQWFAAAIRETEWTWTMTGICILSAFFFFMQWISHWVQSIHYFWQMPRLSNTSFIITTALLKFPSMHNTHLKQLGTFIVLAPFCAFVFELDIQSLWMSAHSCLWLVVVPRAVCMLMPPTIDNTPCVFSMTNASPLTSILTFSPHIWMLFWRSLKQQEQKRSVSGRIQYWSIRPYEKMDAFSDRKSVV